MSEIPEDIARAAVDAVDEMDAGTGEGRIAIVERAILAERERCAGIFDERARVARQHLETGARANQYEYYAGLIRGEA